MESWKRNAARIILIVTALLPVIDVLNGLMIRNNLILGNIGQIIKLVLFGLLFIFYLTKKEKAFALLTILLAFLLVAAHIGTPNNSLSTDLLFFSKIAMIPVAFWGFTNFIKEESLLNKQLFIIISAAWLFYALNAVLSLFGFGDTQYLSGGGLKGFFYAGNEFSLSFLLQTTIIAGTLMQQKKQLSFILFSLAAMLVSFIIGMKTVMIGVLLILIITFTNFATERLIAALKKRIAVVVAVFISLLAIGVGLLYKQNFFYRLQFHRDNGVISFLTSNRDKTAIVAINEFQSFTLKQKLFGIGKNATEKLIGPHFGVTAKAVEMDPIDLLLYGGILTVAIVYSIWIYALIVLLRQDRYLASISFVILLISIIAGHVVYAGMALPYFALLFAQLRNSKQQRFVKIYFIGALSRGGIATYMKQTKQAADNANLNIELVNTHYSSLWKTLLQFPLTIIKLSLATLLSAINNGKIIFHYHVATKGSFLRKYLLASIFWPFTDQQIIHFHSGKTAAFLEKLPNGWLLTDFFRLFNTVIFVSPTLQKEVMTVIKKKGIAVNTDTWLTLPNAIQLPPTLPTPHSYSKNQPLKLLFVGRLVDEKDLPTLVSICTKLKNDNANVKITIVGDGPLKSWLQNEIDTNKLHSVVEYSEWQEHTQLMKTYQQHHGFIITSKQESFGIVVLEAYMNGLFCIATANGGLQDIVIDGKTGYLEPTEKWENLVKRIEQLANTPTEVKKLQHEAQRFVQKFNFAEHIEKLLKIYTKGSY